MSGTTTIEEHVMGAARSYLYGHSHAWSVPGGAHRAPGGAAHRPRRRRIVAAFAARLSPARRADAVPEPCLGC